MRIETLKEFTAIAKYHSYTKAAKALFVSQPTLSAHISSMEKEIGFEVFERGSSKLALTPSGKVLLETAQDIINAYHKAIEKGRELAKKQAPIKMLLSARGGSLYKRIAALESPEILFVDINFGTSMIDAVAEGSVDVTICPDFALSEATRNQSPENPLGFVRTKDERAIIAMEKSHPLAHKTELAKVDLDGMTVSIGNHLYYDEWKDIVQGIFGKDVNLTFRLNPAESEAELAREALNEAVHLCGVAASKQYYAHRDDIVFFSEVDGQEIRYPSGILYRKDCPNEQIVEFVEILREILDEIGEDS